MLTRRLCAAARNALDLTVKDLAELSGAGATTIGRWERNEADLLAGTVRQLHDAFEAQGIRFTRADDGSLGFTYPKALDDADADALKARKKRGGDTTRGV